MKLDKFIKKIKHFNFVIFLSTIIVVLFGIFLIYYVYLKKSKEVEQPELVMSQSVCDEVLSKTELPPVKINQGKPSKVDFSTNPDAKIFYTTITQQATESANFAGHFNFVSWGCGTNCAGFAIVDSITGRIVEYLPVNEDGNSYSYDVNSRILALNPKEDYENFRGKTLKKIFDEDNWYTGSIRQYYKLVEDFEGITSLYKICSENSLDGIYALGGEISDTVVYYAKLKTISTSREARFYWYDTVLKKIKSPDDKYAWFWAMPDKFFDDTALTDKWFKFMDDNSDAVFKITGTRGQDDCDYYGSDHCVEDINVKSIEVVGKNKLMEF